MIIDYDSLTNPVESLSEYRFAATGFVKEPWLLISMTKLIIAYFPDVIEHV